MYRPKDLKDPYSILKRDVEIKYQRIQTLNNDHIKVKHYFSKAIIETELEKVVSDYLEQSFILQRIERESESSEDRT